jgi:chromosome partitioning protein
MRIITTAIQKGGTGKTTTAAALAQAAAKRGRRVLAIDLDPQGNLSFSLGAAMSGPGSYELLQGTPAAEITQQTAAGVDIIPASRGLAAAKTETGSARRLAKALQPVKGYDLIIIDTPPTAGELQYNALQAATGLIIPLQADVYNLQGLYQMTDTARAIMRTNPALRLEGVIFTNFDGRSTIARQMRDTITAKAAALGVPCLGTIRSAAVIKEAAALQQSLFDYAPKSKPAADYMAIFDALEL